MKGTCVRSINFRGFEDLNLVGDVRGNDDAWPVIFLHGGGQTRRAWGKTADEVARRGWRAITVDLRGHGESDWSPTGDYSLVANSADCLAIVRQFNQLPVLIGASLGGMAAMLAVGSTQQEIASGLVLVDIAPKANIEGLDRIKAFMATGVVGFDSLEDAASTIAAYTPQRDKTPSIEGLKRVLRERDGRWFWHWDPRILHEGHTEAVARQFETLLDAAIVNISIPTTLVRGQLSDVVTREEIEHLLNKMPGVEVVEVEGAAHMIAGDQNNAFSSVVVSFLEERIRRLHVAKDDSTP